LRLIYLSSKLGIIFFGKIIFSLYNFFTNQLNQGFNSLRSSLFRFLLAGESESQGEVARTHGARAKRGTGGEGVGREGKACS